MTRSVDLLRQPFGACKRKVVLYTLIVEVAALFKKRTNKILRIFFVSLTLIGHKCITHFRTFKLLHAAVLWSCQIMVMKSKPASASASCIRRKQPQILIRTVLGDTIDGHIITSAVNYLIVWLIVIMAITGFYCVLTAEKPAEKCSQFFWKSIDVWKTETQAKTYWTFEQLCPSISLKLARRCFQLDLQRLIGDYICNASPSSRQLLPGA